MFSSNSLIQNRCEKIVNHNNSKPMICEDAINPIPTVQTLKNVRKKNQTRINEI